MKKEENQGKGIKDIFEELTKDKPGIFENPNQIQDMTNVYNGTENTNRSIFNQHVNWDTYKRKV